MSTKRKPKFDICAEYTEDSKNLLENTEKLFESFIRFKFEYIKNKSKELEQRKKSTQNKINNKESETYIIGNIQKTQQISGIYINPQEKLRKHINKLPKHSFIIWFRFKLKAPYFSKDNDEIYIIQNPILKETNFKTPMIRGSGWKGALAHAFRELINESKWEEKKSKIESFLRIFGAGSESIKTLEKYLKNKTANLKEFKENFLAFILFELGLEINKDSLIQIKEADSYKDISNKIAEYVWKKYKEIKNSGFLPLEFQTHKGRAIFYPTYFNKLSLEIINPHDRRKRAGTKPIHYEVVPEGTEGIFQLTYIPFDGIVEKDDTLKTKAEKDLNNLIQALEKLADTGIGAKTKLGWGRFKISDRKVFDNSSLKIPEGWGKWQN